VLYLLQWRKLKLKTPTLETPESIEGREVIFQGKPVGYPKAAVLNVCTNIYKFEDGDALFLDGFNPENYPFMIRAGAILCTSGGETCHAAIVARDIGIIAI